MSPPREHCFPTRRIGRRVLSYDQVDSTNTIAATHAHDTANDGLVILADEQTAGRGRQGRRWLAPPGSSVLMSVLLFPPEHVRRPVFLTPLAAIAVCETIYDCTGLQAAIKWPNDVLLHGRKVCGILVEQGQATVIGIGLNVSTSAEAFAAAELFEAGSLSMFTESAVDRAEIVNTLILRLDAAYEELLQGFTTDLEARWRWHSGLLGRRVVIHGHGQTHEGRLLELSFAGIVLEASGGEIRHLEPERVEQIVDVG